MATNLNLLMEYVKNGDEDAFEEIYCLFKDRVFYTILAILKDYHLSEDIMQDVFIRIRQNIQSYIKGTNAAAWIITIARNTALNEYKRRLKETPVDISQSEYLFDSYTIDNKGTPLLNEMLKTLDVREREIVTLYVIGGFKHHEIAKIVSRPLGTVLWLYNKAIKKLRKELGKEEG